MMTSRLLISLLKNQNGDKLQKNVEKKKIRARVGFEPTTAELDTLDRCSNHLS
jgi:hypothetical protein